MTSLLVFPGGKHTIERIFPGAGESQSERDGQERKLKLITADETLADPDQHDRAEHVSGKEQAEGPREQAEYDGDSAKELEEGDGWPRNGG